MAAIHLQNIGKVTAIKASELQEGMLIMWNFGSTSKVLEVKEVSRCFLNVYTEYESMGKMHLAVQKMKKDRLVAGFWPRKK